jgi:hypothetical protein
MRVYLALFIALAPIGAVSQEVTRIRVVDVPRNASQLLGQRITLTRCNLTDAAASQVYCIPGSANPSGPVVILSMKDMTNATFDRLLRDCSMGGPQQVGRCNGSATGVLDKVNGGWQLSNVSIAWEDTLD